MLIANEPVLGERIEVHALDTIVHRLYELNVGRPTIATRDEIRQLLSDASGAAGAQRFSTRFLLSEWEDVVDAWQLGTWEAYRDVARLGRKTRLPEAQRQILWTIFDGVRALMTVHGLVTWADLYGRLAEQYQAIQRAPFDFVVVDEAQDLSVPQLRFLAALGASQPDALFFAGDLGQRIFQQPFCWKALGVDVHGRARTLRINYRTSHQIRAQADRLLGPEASDVDGITESRRGTTSVFNGPEPDVHVLDRVEGEAELAARWLAERAAEVVKPHEIGVFVRSDAELPRARAALAGTGLEFKVLDESVAPSSGQVSIGTMHLAKGLEFRAVAVTACDDEIIPLQERMETASDPSDLDEMYATERHLLYVACTRARDRLLITAVAPASEFLDDLRH